ncbi:hypothetical protein ABEB36_002660 [Hypothenemus hampei]|uniref:Uncharacterized protein n=1 Tax=Hypothenemus hampei TaxID=57062 RepID=A0ABD1FA72_HYPHA
MSNLNIQDKKVEETLVHKRRSTASQVIVLFKSKFIDKKKHYPNGAIKTYRDFYKKALLNCLRFKLKTHAAKYREQRRSKTLQTSCKSWLEEVGRILLKECEVKEDIVHQTKLKQQQNKTEDQERKE